MSQHSYSPLDRIENNNTRLYITPTGNLPSVTTILSATVSEEKTKYLNDWREAVGHKYASEVTHEASCRGTRMHAYLENYVIDGELKPCGSNPYAKEAHLMASTIIENGMCQVDECWGTEIDLYFPSIYAGATDLVGVHAGDEAIMDFKQSNKEKTDDMVHDYKVQLTAYAEAHNELYNTRIKKGVILMAVKPTLYPVFNPPKYLEWILQGNEFDKYRREWWTRVEEYYRMTNRINT